MSDRPAEIVSSKIHFGAFTPEPKPQPLPNDWSEILRASTVMACALVPAGEDGDEYNEELVKERQRVSNGLMKIKGERYYEPLQSLPTASQEEIMELMDSPSYLQWKAEAEWNADWQEGQFRFYSDDTEYLDEQEDYHEYHHDGYYHRFPY